MPDKSPLKILAISGSLRKASLNTWLIKAAQTLAIDDVRIELYDGLGAIPPYDDDVRAIGYPVAVDDLRELVRAADALMIATPEYNRSFSGVLKNAIDWISRPPEQPLSGKAALVVGASMGMLGTAAANYQLRQVLSVLNVHVVPGPEVLVNLAQTKFDETGALVHADTREALIRAIGELAGLARRLRRTND